MTSPPPLTIETALRPVRRWTPQRKRELIDFVARGHLALDQVRVIHGISLDEFARWRELERVDGLRGLQAQRQGARGRR